MNDTIEGLTGGGKREKTHDAQMVFKLPASAKALVQELAAEQEVSEAVIIRRALGEFFEKRGLSE